MCFKLLIPMITHLDLSIWSILLYFLFFLLKSRCNHLLMIYNNFLLLRNPRIIHWRKDCIRFISLHNSHISRIRLHTIYILLKCTKLNWKAIIHIMLLCWLINRRSFCHSWIASVFNVIRRLYGTLIICSLISLL